MVNYNFFKDIHINDAAKLFMDTFNDSPWNENWDSAFAIQRIKNIYTTPGFKGVVCLENSTSEIIGFCIGNIEAWENYEVFYLNELCIKSSYQCKGIGKKLINILEKELNNIGINKIFLSTIRGKEGPKEFFGKSGFIIEEERIRMIKTFK